MIKNKRIEFSCWICKRKESDMFYGMVSMRDPKDERKLLFQTGEKGAKELYIKLTAISLKSKNYNELNIPMCGICIGILQKITHISKKSKEKIPDDSKYFS